MYVVKYNYCEFYVCSTWKYFSDLITNITFYVNSGLNQCKSQKVNILVNQVLNVKRLFIKISLITLIKER